MSHLVMSQLVKPTRLARTMVLAASVTFAAGTVSAADPVTVVS